MNYGPLGLLSSLGLGRNPAVIYSDLDVDV